MKMDPDIEITAAGKPRSKHGSRKNVLIAVVILCGIMGAFFAAGYLPRAERVKKLAAAAQNRQHTLPSVTIVPVKRALVDAELELPGNIEPVAQAALFARADGYVKRRLADIGDRVKRGQVLAQIESPELDQQIREAQATAKRSQSSVLQSEAALEQARANLSLAEVTAARWQPLVDKGVFSKQDGDEKQAALKARRADVAEAEAALQCARENVAANDAAVQRLFELQSFRRLRAPFAGIVTARNVDVGSLVSAGSGTSIRELFRVAQIGILRVFVNVPQSEIQGMEPGLACSLEVEELHGKMFPGRITRTANALDPASRTLLTEVQVANPTGALLPGMYATVHFSLHSKNPPLVIPSAAFRNTDEGPVVAVLGEDSSVHFKSVRLGRDYGAQIEVLAGLQAGQKVITNLSDEIREGVRVKPVAAAKSVMPAGRGQEGRMK
jgi:RND family efflux transporter MFP subunit